jgi:hypothetical protein
MGVATASGRIAIGARAEVLDYRDFLRSRQSSRPGDATTPAFCRAIGTSPGTSASTRSRSPRGSYGSSPPTSRAWRPWTPSTASSPAGRRPSSPSWSLRTAAT